MVAHADAVGQDAKANKARAVASLMELTLNRMDAQSQGGEVGFNLRSAFLKNGAVIAEARKIIHIADVLFHFQGFFDVTVEAIEIDVGKELAGEVADRESFRTFEGRQQGIAGKVVDDGFAFAAIVEDLVNQPQGIPAFQFVTN